MRTIPLLAVMAFLSPLGARFQAYAGPVRFDAPAGCDDVTTQLSSGSLTAVGASGQTILVPGAVQAVMLAVLLGSSPPEHFVDALRLSGGGGVSEELAAALTGLCGDPPDDQLAEAYAHFITLIASASPAYLANPPMEFLATQSVLQQLWHAALPVELASFTARLEGPTVVLAWETVSETNNAGFDVEHQVEGAWRPIGFAPGHGTTTEAQRYENRVQGLAPGVHRFRLRQVDYDGTFEYGPDVEVAVAVPGSHLLSEAYPTPFRAQTTFTLSVAVVQHVRLAVYDVLGRQVALLQDGAVEAGKAQRFTFEGAGLPSGTYLLRAWGETFAETRALVLAR